MEKLVLNILSYLDYLNKKCNLNVSIHFDIKVVQALPQKAIKALLKYNSHTNPYCISIKRKHRNRCLFHQKDIIKTCPNENFCTVCHAGVKERIYPIFVGETAIGFATVCGYREKDCTDYLTDHQLWESALREEDIPTDLCDAIIPPLVIMLTQLYTQYASEPTDEYGMIIEFLNEYHSNITLSDLCAHFLKSKSYISHLFKKKSGMTLRSYCNKLKIEDAKKLLKNTNMPITKIAFDVGFNDVSYFVSLFKKESGESPLQYRKLHRS